VSSILLLPDLIARLVPSPFFAPVVGVMLTLSHVEHRDSADGGGGALAHFHWQADEGELVPAEQCLQVAQAFDMGDVEIEAGLAHKQIEEPL